ncbi:MAG: Ig-like domain-containing protein [Lautropia sp.]|nr:Ig-like domain-containing protein [Lautropia sp.]
MTPRLDIHRTTDGGVEPVRLKPGTNKIKVVPGRQYKLLDPDNQLTAEQLRVLQVDTDLIIEEIPLEGGEKASVVLEGYYQVCSASDQCEVSAGGEEGNAVLLADVNTKALGALSDGAYVLYDPSYQAPASPVLEDFPIRPVLYGVGGAAVLGLALAGGGGGGGDGSPPTGDIPLALKSSTSFNTRFPTIAGTAAPGTEVQLRLDTDGDLRENVTYVVTADAAGNWAVNLQSATPATGTLPAAGLSDSNSLAITGTLNGVQNSLPLSTLTFDNVPPAKAEILAVAEDGIITGAERTAGVPVSGTAEANGSVEITLGNHTVLVPVDAEGKWTTTLAEANLPATDGDYVMTVTAIDAAGNRGPAATTPVILNITGTKPAIGLVAGNDIINAAEAAAPIAIAGTAEAGSTVKVSLGTATQDVTAGADGKWSASLSLPAGLADGKHNVTVETTNTLGNRATGTREVTLDRTAPARATGININDGTEVSYQESRDGIIITGSAEAGSNVLVTVGQTTHQATVGANSQWRVQFTAGELPVPGPGQTNNTAVSVVVEDSAENRSAAATTPLVLQGQTATPAPTINPITTDNIVSAQEAASPIRITGTAQPGATVTLGGAATGSAVANASGIWAIEASLGSLTAGAYTITATATVPGGTTSAQASRNFTVEAAPAAAEVDIVSISGDDIVSATEAGSPVPVTGTATANATVTVSFNGTSQTVTAGADGTWTANLSIPGTLAAGSYTVTASVAGTAGSAAATDSEDFTLQRATTPAPAPAPEPPAAPSPAPGTPSPPPSGETPAPSPPPTDPTDSPTTPAPAPDGTSTTPAGGGAADNADASGTPATPATPAAPAADAAPTTPSAPSAPPAAGGAPASAAGEASGEVTGSAAATPGSATATPGATSATPGDAAAPSADAATASAQTSAGSSAGSSTTTKSLTLEDLLSSNISIPVASSGPAPTPTPAPTTVSSGATLDSLVGSTNPWEQQHSPLG